MEHQRGATGRAAIAIVAIAVVMVAVAGAYYTIVIWKGSTQTEATCYNGVCTSTTSSCSGYPPGGNCPGTYNYTFTLSVNYTGPWKLSYQGYNSLGQSNPTGVSGNSTGRGFYAKSVTLSGPNTSGLTLCATAQKLDASTATLILTVTGYNETSAPYGSTSYCGGVVP
jgi:hypothetical protein